MIVLSVKYLKRKNFTGAKYFSQTTNATRHTTPITIMEIILPFRHLFAEEDARLKGRRIKENPAEVKIIPTTW